MYTKAARITVEGKKLVLLSTRYLWDLHGTVLLDSCAGNVLQLLSGYSRYEVEKITVIQLVLKILQHTEEHNPVTP